jgi:hypothetical protein
MNRPNEAHHIVVIGRGADSFVLAARLGTNSGAMARHWLHSSINP